MAVDIAAVLTANIDEFKAKMAEADATMKTTTGSGSSAFSKMSSLGKTALMGIAGGAAIVGVASVKMAADFQTAMTQLVTGAGESQKNIKMVGDGILNMAGPLGTTTQQLSQGMYMIESAGYHGAAGLSVLHAAAEGAKVGAADLGTVADALTTALTDYHLPASDAATVTSQLVATVASGKTHMQDLAGAMATVLPAASAAGVGLAQVLGAMATMTAKGVPAADAATYLRQTLLQLSNPTAKAANEMKSLGLNSIDISRNLGKVGLTGTLEELTTAIADHMGPAGTVLIDQLKSASHNTTTFQKVLANLPPTQQTYIAALADMVGGTKSMQAALSLTGDSAMTFYANVKTIGDTTAATGNNVQGWSAVQKDLNFQIQQAEAAAQALAIKLGDALIPKIEEGIKAVTTIVTWFEKHKTAAEALGIAIGALVAGAIAVYIVNVGINMVQATGRAIDGLGRLAGALLGTGGAAETSATEMTAASTAAGEEGMAGSMAVGETAAGGLVGVLGPLALAAGAVTLGAMALGKAMAGSGPAFAGMTKSAIDMSANTLPELTLKMAALKEAQDKAAKSMTDGGFVAGMAKVAYEGLGVQIDRLKTQHAELSSNLTILSSNFGISKGQAEQLAQVLGINLTQALSPAQVTAFSQQIQQSGLNMDTAGSKAQNMGTTTVAAVSQMAAQMKATLTGTDWSQFGTSVDTGMAAGITNASGVVIAATQGMVQSVISTARTGLKAASPSRVAADQIGLPFVQGVAAGILENTGMLRGVVTSMGAQMVAAGGSSSPVTGFAMGGGSSPSPSGGTGPATIVLQLNGVEVARALFPDLQTVLLQNKRTMVTLGLG